MGDDAILPGHLATSLVIPAMCISQDAADGVVRDSANLVESSLAAPAISRAADKLDRLHLFDRSHATFDDYLEHMTELLKGSPWG